jgi:hypothetical protein
VVVLVSAALPPKPAPPLFLWAAQPPTAARQLRQTDVCQQYLCNRPAIHPEMDAGSAKSVYDE